VSAAEKSSQSPHSTMGSVVSSNRTDHISPLSCTYTFTMKNSLKKMVGRFGGTTGGGRRSTGVCICIIVYIAVLRFEDEMQCKQRWSNS